AAEEAETGLLDLDRGQAHHVQDGEGDQGFGRALELVHLLFDRAKALHGVGDTDRQGEEHETEGVAQLVRLVEPAEVDRDGGADGDAGRGFAALLEVAPQRAGRGGDEDVVDRRAESLADRKSTRLNSSHVSISYAVFCLK